MGEKTRLRAVLNVALLDVAVEVLRAEVKFPTWPNDLLHGVAVVAEESGEAVKAALDAHYKRAPVGDYRKELVHTAAMCLRAIMAVDCRGKRGKP